MPKPPETLTEPMEVDPAVFDAVQTNFLMTGLVIPRAIGWISTVSTDGIANLSPFSFFTVASSDPPHLLFSGSEETKDSVVNARETGCFVANVVDGSLLEQVVTSSAAVAPSTDEFNLAGLKKAPSRKVIAPRVAAAKAHLECEVTQIVKVSRSSLVIGRVVHLHIDPSIWAGGRVQPGLLNPVARLGGSYYAPLGEPFSRVPPAINERG